MLLNHFEFYRKNIILFFIHEKKIYLISLLVILFSFNYNTFAKTMKDLPYHHLPDGTFRNPEGSPVRDSSFNWSFKIFNEEKKKLNMSFPSRTCH